LWPPSNTSLTWRSVTVKEMQLLGGQTPPRKYDYLAVYYPQENVFTWRLVTPKKINFLDYRLIFLSSWQSVVCPCFPWRVGSQGNLAWGLSLPSKLGGSCMMVHRRQTCPWRFLAAKGIPFCGSVASTREARQRPRNNPNHM
jgi:hypothetical protein